MAQNTPYEGVQTHDPALRFTLDAQDLDYPLQAMVRLSWATTAEYARLRATPKADRNAVLDAWGIVAEQLLSTAKLLEDRHRAFAASVLPLAQVIDDAERALRRTAP
jgi:hypothetical protein